MLTQPKEKGELRFPGLIIYCYAMQILIISDSQKLIVSCQIITTSRQSEDETWLLL